MRFVKFWGLGSESCVRPETVRFLRTAVVEHEGEQVTVTQIVLVGEPVAFVNVEEPIGLVARELQEAAR